MSLVGVLQVEESDSAGVRGRLGSGTRRSSRFEIPGLHDGLTDQTDWDAETWDLRSDCRREMIRHLQRFSSEFGPRFSLFVSWIGERPLREEAVSLDEVCRLIERNQLGNRDSKR